MLYLMMKSNLILRDKVIKLFVAFWIWMKDSLTFTMWAKMLSSCLKFWLYWDSNKKSQSSDKLLSLKKMKTNVVSSDERFIDFWAWMMRLVLEWRWTLLLILIIRSWQLLMIIHWWCKFSIMRFELITFISTSILTFSWFTKCTSMIRTAIASFSFASSFKWILTIANSLVLINLLFTSLIEIKNFMIWIWRSEMLFERNFLSIMIIELSKSMQISWKTSLSKDILTVV